MRNEALWNFFLVAILSLGLLIRGAYLRAAHRRRGPAATRESRWSMALQAGFYTIAFGLILAHLARPRLLAWANLSLCFELRWAGVVLGFASLALLVWVHRALDKNCSLTLSVREEHTLVTHGPYARIRHPMYAAWYLLHLAVFLITANGLIGFFLLGVYTVPITLRMREEEAMLAEEFGENYAAYREKTGRVLPRLRRKP